MGKWMVVKDQDEDDHNQRSTANLPAHTQKNKVIAQGINVYVGDSGGIGSGNTLANGILADQDEVDDNPSTADIDAARQEAIANGANPDDDTGFDPGQAGNRAGVNTVCGTVPSYPSDSYPLSPNFTLGMLSSKAVFPHRISAQNGLSVPTLVCNLKGLCVNILEPLRVKYPGLRINSGFRRGSGKSQHLRGMAVDIQWAGLPNSAYLDRAKWVRDNLPFDQLLMEHGKSIWLHISYDRNKKVQRGDVRTMIGGRYPPGLKLYY